MCIRDSPHSIQKKVNLDNVVSLYLAYFIFTLYFEFLLPTWLCLRMSWNFWNFIIQVICVFTRWLLHYCYSVTGINCDLFPASWTICMYFRLFICLCVCFFVCFYVPLENFTPIWRHHLHQERAANFDLCSTLMAIEQWRFFSVPQLFSLTKKKNREKNLQFSIWMPIIRSL